jgi:hypothetical protein
MNFLEKAMDDLYQSVHAYVSKAFNTLSERMTAVEKRVSEIPAGPKGDKGDDGKDADPALIEVAVQKYVAAIPVPKDGRDGVDGKDADPEFIKSEIAKAVAQIPAPKDGVPGRDGIDGAPGKDADEAAIIARLTEHIQCAVEALPKAKDGEPGKDAPPVDEKAIVQRVRELIPTPRDGKDAEPVDFDAVVAKAVSLIPVPKNGQDGKSVTVEDVLPRLMDSFEAAFAKWALEVERRAMDLFQKTADSMPIPKDGKDAFNLEDLSVEHDGDGNVTLRFERGELKKEFVLRLPRFKDKGVYKDGETYREGDGVTYGGSFWLAQKDNPEGKPDSGNGHWRLAVKRGRDGRDGEPPTPKGTGGPVRLR